MNESPKAPVLAVGAVIFDDEGRVCLIRRARPPLLGQWTLPGGRVERGEGLAAALAREVREETGLVVEVGQLVEPVELIEDDRHFVVLDYRCRIVGGELVAGDDASEAAMVPVDRLGDYAVTQAVHDVVAAARRRRDRRGE